MSRSHGPSAGPPPKRPRRGASSRYKARAARKRDPAATRKEPEINFLNITAMLDMMTIILVFLLKSMGESSASIPQSTT